MNRSQEAIKLGKIDEDDLPEFDRCLGKVGQLQELVDRLERMESERRRPGWFASSPPDSQLVQHVSVIIWFLSHKYSIVSKSYEAAKATKSSAMEHLKKVQEKRLHALASIKKPSQQSRSSTASSPKSNTASLPIEEDRMEVSEFAAKYGLSDDQVQMLQQEKNHLFHELADMQTQIKQTEKSVSEIARLQATLQESLTFQEGQIERIFEDAEFAIDMVSKGNVYLNKASKSQSTFRTIMVSLILFMTFIMLFMHFYLD